MAVQNSNIFKVKTELAKHADPQRAKLLQRFFKTGKGEYAQGDVFLGLSVPQVREIAKRHQNLSLLEIERLLESKFHEHRLLALLVLVAKFKSADEKGRKQIVDFYLSHTKRINNWDLVDLSAPRILGAYLGTRDRAILFRLASSSSLWEKRIAVLASFYFINEGQFDDSLKIARILIRDSHDLIHKALGWMLREIGKRDQEAEEKFLRRHLTELPRTTLRYAIERFPETKRKAYLRGDL